MLYPFEKISVKDKLPELEDDWYGDKISPVVFIWCNGGLTVRTGYFKQVFDLWVDGTCEFEWRTNCGDALKLKDVTHWMHVSYNEDDSNDS